MCFYPSVEKQLIYAILIVASAIEQRGGLPLT